MDKVKNRIVELRSIIECAIMGEESVPSKRPIASLAGLSRLNIRSIATAWKRLYPSQTPIGS